MPARLVYQLLFVICLSLCFGSWARAQVDPAAADEEAEEVPFFQPRKVVEKFPAIVEPTILRAAAKSRLRDEEMVLGVVVNGEACAYPINMLTQPTREIINDRLGGQAIAATW